MQDRWTRTGSPRRLLGVAASLSLLAASGCAIPGFDSPTEARTDAPSSTRDPGVGRETPPWVVEDTVEEDPTAEEPSRITFGPPPRDPIDGDGLARGA